MKEFIDSALLAPLTELGNRLLELSPNFLAMVIILSIGWITAWVLGAVMERLLRVIGLDHLSNRLGATAASSRGRRRPNFPSKAMEPSRGSGTVRYSISAGSIAS